MDDVAKRNFAIKDFARIVRGHDGRQVAVYIEHAGKEDYYALVVMVAYPTPMSNTYALEHGSLAEMEHLLEWFDAEQAASVLHCYDMYDKRAGMLDRRQCDVRPFRR